MEQYGKWCCTDSIFYIWNGAGPPSVSIISGQPAAGTALKDPKIRDFYIITPPATLKQMVHSGSDCPSASSDTTHTPYH